ncbi:Translation initiation factor eIF-2B subunit alpha [Monocercomonoides exilis]|uniref:Translation initiation factor eIF-2B subunit alpha n=1 Tax=Monocercomonoides exilis TaxID=2049356 RepID=UPI003559A786|nr:Translation initiation factor eIF-2B subunit alpha [Monocercomonoides exilis]
MESTIESTSSTEPSASSLEFDVVKEYEIALQKETSAVATKIALAKLVSQSKETTLQGLRRELKEASDRLANEIRDIPIKSVCDLFMIELAREMKTGEDFETTKARLVEKGKQNEKITEIARHKIALEAERFFFEGLRVTTLSYSRVVLQCLVEASKKWKIHVDVLQGGPDEPGKKMVNDLMEQKIECRYVPDCCVSSVVAATDIVLVGAAAVTENGGIINKMGTRTLACVAKEHNKDFFVAVESYKFTKLYPLSQHHLETLVPIRGIGVEPEGLPKGARTYSPELEYTPPSYIRNLWTDIGIKTPSNISEDLFLLFNL